MQYVDCDRAEKHGDLCLGYGYEEIDEPCEICKNCIKCEGGSYQLGETEKDDKIQKLQEQIEKMKCCANCKSFRGYGETCEGWGEPVLNLNCDCTEWKLKR